MTKNSFLVEVTFKSNEILKHQEKQLLRGALRKIRKVAGEALFTESHLTEVLISNTMNSTKGIFLAVLQN